MTDGPLLLARLRAGGADVVADLDMARAAAARAGRRIVNLGAAPRGARATLGWPDDVELSPETWAVPPRSLSPSAASTLAACLGCCWPDPATDPHPGERVAATTVLATARGNGLDERWAKAALFHDLPALGFVEVTGEHVRLGPAIAALPRAEIELLRRAHSELPRPGEQP